MDHASLSRQIIVHGGAGPGLEGVAWVGVETENEAGCGWFGRHLFQLFLSASSYDHTPDRLPLSLLRGQFIKRVSRSLNVLCDALPGSSTSVITR